MKPASVWAAGAILLALGVWFLATAGGTAADAKEGVNADIRKVADALKEGKEADARKLAAALLKKADGDLEAVMRGYQLRAKKGLGVGSAPGTIAPDGIEATLIIARRIRPAQLSKNAAAYAQMGYDSAAIAEAALQSVPEKNEGKKTKAAWTESTTALRQASLDLAKAAQANDAPAAKAAMVKMNTTCTNCHNIFREK